MLLCILDTETTCSFSLWMAELTSPHNVHVLLFETCECIILYGKKNWLWLRILNRKIILDNLSGPKIIMRVLMTRRQERQHSGYVKTEARSWNEVGKSCELRKGGSL